MRENELTIGSNNTNRIYEILDYEFARAERYGIKVTLLFIKIAQLGEIGRKYGEQTAARIFREVYQLICLNIRHIDREFIYGRDEFLIILPHTPKERARNLIAKLKGIIEDYPFTDNGDHRFTLSPKFGISSYPLDVRSRREVDKLAESL